MIRAAIASDIDAITDGALRAYAQSAITAPRPELARGIIMEVLARSLAIVAIGEGGKMIGSAGLVRRAWDHSGEPYLSDRWFYAAGPHAFRDLLRGARAVAGRAKLPLILGISGEAAMLKARLYTIHGGEIVGALVRFP